MSCLPITDSTRTWVNGPGWNCNKDNIKQDCENVQGYSLYGGYTMKNSSRCIGKGTGSDKAKRNNYRAKCFKNNKDYPTDIPHLVKCCTGEMAQKDCPNTHCPGSSTCGALMIRKCYKDGKYLYDGKSCNETTLSGIKDAQGNVMSGKDRLNSAHLYFCGLGDNVNNQPECKTFCDTNPGICKDMMVKRCTVDKLKNPKDYCRSYVKKFGNEYTDIENNVQEYCKLHPEDLFCSCSSTAIDLEPSYGKYDQLKKAPSCYIKKCIEDGYEFKYQKDWKNQQGGCPPMQICDINIASLDSSKVSNVGCKQTSDISGGDGETTTYTNEETEIPKENVSPEKGKNTSMTGKKKYNILLILLIIFVAFISVVGMAYIYMRKSDVELNLND